MSPFFTMYSKVLFKVQINYFFTRECRNLLNDCIITKTFFHINIQFFASCNIWVDHNFSNLFSTEVIFIRKSLSRRDKENHVHKQANLWTYTDIITKAVPPIYVRKICGHHTPLFAYTVFIIFSGCTFTKKIMMTLFSFDLVYEWYWQFWCSTGKEHKWLSSGKQWNLATSDEKRKYPLISWLSPKRIPEVIIFWPLHNLSKTGANKGAA